MASGTVISERDPEDCGGKGFGVSFPGPVMTPTDRNRHGLTAGIHLTDHPWLEVIGRRSSEVGRWTRCGDGQDDGAGARPDPRSMARGAQVQPFFSLCKRSPLLFPCSGQKHRAHGSDSSKPGHLPRPTATCWGWLLRVLDTFSGTRRFAPQTAISVASATKKPSSRPTRRMGQGSASVSQSVGSQFKPWQGRKRENWEAKGTRKMIRQNWALA